MKNKEIRHLIKENALHQWMVADAVGISEATFCRWMRKELEGEQKTIILRAIEMLTKEKRGTR